jgi:thiamine-monophosphate kinase
VDGEFELIERLVERLPEPGEAVRVGSGDDAAVTEHEGPVVISVDALVEGIHFTRPEFPPEAIGRKALAAALSDLAAMGAEAGEAYVVLGVPADASEAELLALADGLAAVASREGVSVVGGDITAAPALLLSVTAIGSEPKGSPLITRAGAQPGDRVVVTGELGGAAAALELLRSRRDELDPALLARQLDPRPRLGAGRALAAAGASAMIDLSDGLAADAAQLARRSDVRLEIDLQRLPLAPELLELHGDEQAARRQAAEGGEDFELLACLRPDAVEAATEAVRGEDCALGEIGVVTEGGGAVVRDASGAELELGGYDHLRPPGGYQ